MARIFFLNHQELSQNGKKQRKKGDFLRNIKSKHNLLLDLSERSHENLCCNVVPVDIPSVVRELSLKNRRANDKSAFTIPTGPFCVNSQDVVKAPSPIFLKFYSNCHYPIWWTSEKFEWNLSRNGTILKLFSWGGVASGEQILHVWPCSKPYYCQSTLVNNLSISGMLVTLPNVEKITLSTLWPSKVMAPQIWLFLSLATNFRKFQTPCVENFKISNALRLPGYAPPTKKLYNHAIFWQISFKVCRCSSYGVMTIWVKFQENWRGCLDHFLRIDTEWP